MWTYPSIRWPCRPSVWRCAGPFYDLDLCFRLREAGLLNVYTPYASVQVGELRDRTLADLPGEAEMAYVWRRWWGELVRLLHYRHSPLHPSAQETNAETLTLLGP